MGYLRLQRLDAVVKKDGDLEKAENAKNEGMYTELIQVLDDTSLSIIMKEEKDDG